MTDQVTKSEESTGVIDEIEKLAVEDESEGETTGLLTMIFQNCISLSLSLFITISRLFFINIHCIGLPICVKIDCSSNGVHTEV